MRELTLKEIDLVAGGPAPLIAAAVSLAISFGSGFAARSLASYAVTRIGFVAASVGFASTLSSSKKEEEQDD